MLAGSRTPPLCPCCASPARVTHLGRHAAAPLGLDHLRALGVTLLLRRLLPSLALAGSGGCSFAAPTLRSPRQSGYRWCSKVTVGQMIVLMTRKLKEAAPRWWCRGQLGGAPPPLASLCLWRCPLAWCFPVLWLLLCWPCGVEPPMRPHSSALAAVHPLHATSAATTANAFVSTMAPPSKSAYASHHTAPVALVAPMGAVSDPTPRWLSSPKQRLAPTPRPRLRPRR